MEDIVVIGAGGFARETKFLIKCINSMNPAYRFLGYLISDLDKLSDYDSKDEVIGDFDWFNDRTKPINVALGVGTPEYRLKLANEIFEKYPKVKFPTLIHPNVIYDEESCKFEKGVIVCASNILTVNITLCEFSLVNLNCTIGHEAVIGAGSVLNPTVNISGGVEIGKEVLVGTGAQILQYLKIGDKAIIGAGACVRKNVDNSTTVIGVPAKPFTKIFNND